MIDDILTALENAVERDTYKRFTQHISGRSPKSIHAEAKQKLEAYVVEKQKEILEKFNLPEYDHSKCLLPQSCIGYQNAQSDFDNEKSILIESLTKDDK